MNAYVCEHERILQAFQARGRRRGGRFFVYEDLAHICRLHERYRETLRMLARAGYHPLTDLRILDVGCGDGNMLRQFVQWGGTPEHLAGIDLRPEPIERACRLNPSFDVRCGSAVELPWEDGTFDLVCQHTVFTSILSSEMRQQTAAEMSRVLRRQGAILWYDFKHNNPWNPDVRGVKAREIRALFPSYKITLRRISLVSPLARRLPTFSLPCLYPLLSAISPLRTHYLGLLIKP